MTDDNGETPLHRAVLNPHDELAQLGPAAHDLAASDEPRHSWRTADTYVSAIARHLAAAQEVLVPAVRKHLPDGDRRAADYLHCAKALERHLHAVKARMYGDRTASRLHLADLWELVEYELAQHVRHEQQLVEELAAALSDTGLAELATKVDGALAHAPTRPHPHSPHAGVAGRTSHRLWRVADDVWDNLESRTLPRQRKPDHPGRNSLLTRYVTGTPAVEAEPGPHRRVEPPEQR